MDNTDFIQSAEQKARRATVHQKHPDGTIEPIIDHEVEQNPEFFMGGGGLCGLPADYAAFIQMMLAGGKSKTGEAVLRPETVALMGQNHIAPLEAGVIKVAMPTKSHDVDFFPGQRLGWVLSLSSISSPPPKGAARSPQLGRPRQHLFLDRSDRWNRRPLHDEVIPFADPAMLAAYSAFERTVYDELAAAKAA